jgi:transcriptional regulator with XRE-family HTH domain
MTQPHGKGFDADGFYRALAATVTSRGITWKKVAEETNVSATTLTRMAQGRKPDASSLAILAHWAGLDVARFVTVEKAAPSAEPLAMATMYLQSDPNLSDEHKELLTGMLTSTYVSLKKKKP